MGKRGWRWPDGTQVLDGPGHGPSELARARLRTGPVTVRRALGEARDRRRLVPVADRFAARPGSAAAVRARPADRLTGRRAGERPVLRSDGRGRAAGRRGPGYVRAAAESRGHRPDAAVARGRCVSIRPGSRPGPPGLGRGREIRPWRRGPLRTSRRPRIRSTWRPGTCCCSRTTCRCPGCSRWSSAGPTGPRGGRAGGSGRRGPPASISGCRSPRTGSPACSRTGGSCPGRAAPPRTGRCR